MSVIQLYFKRNAMHSTQMIGLFWYSSTPARNSFTYCLRFLTFQCSSAWNDRAPKFC